MCMRRSKRLTPSVRAPARSTTFPKARGSASSSVGPSGSWILWVSALQFRLRGLRTGWIVRLLIVFIFRGCDNRTARLPLDQYRSFARAAQQILLYPQAGLRLVVVVVGHFLKFLAFIFGTAGQCYVTLVIVGFFGFGVVVIGRLAVSIEFGDIPHVV